MNEPADGRGRAGSGSPARVRRRRLVAAVAAGGLGSLGGCSDWVDASSDPGEAPEDGAWQTTVEGRLEDVEFLTPTGALGAVAFDVGFLRHPETRERRFVLAEAVEETASSVSIRLRDGLEWSNGDPLTAAEIGRWVFMYRAGSWFAPVPEIRSGDRLPRSPVEAITDVEWDASTVTVEGRFETIASPLTQLNTFLGSRPGAYYDHLWREFQRAYDDTPWEDAATRTAVADLVDEHIWRVGRERLPGGAVRLEDEETDGVEAAFSGLWYPSRRRQNRLSFTVNESHPFADRTELDEMIWTFQPASGAAIRALESGASDGTMQTEVTEDSLDGLPPVVDSIEGPSRDVVTLVLNQTATHLWRRDARAALQYAIDRRQLLEDTALATLDAISVPGADLQSERWAPPDFRERLRSYEHDPDRAASLLETAGFERDGGQWTTPSGEPFELDLLTARQYPNVALAVSAQLEAFGVETSVHTVEASTYQDRIDQRYFAATRGEIWSPNGTGLRGTRTADHVERIRRGDGFHESGYLQREVRRAVETDPALGWAPDSRDVPISDRGLAYDSLDSLRSIVVEAPPLDDPEGELREWPYLYHAARATSAPDPADRIEHARMCTWIYNYQVPVLELLSVVPRIVHRSDGWEIPDSDDPVWQYGPVRPGGLWTAMGLGVISAT